MTAPSRRISSHLGMHTTVNVPLPLGGTIGVGPGGLIGVGPVGAAVAGAAVAGAAVAGVGGATEALGLAGGAAEGARSAVPTTVADGGAGLTMLSGVGATDATDEGFVSGFPATELVPRALGSPVLAEGIVGAGLDVLDSATIATAAIMSAIAQETAAITHMGARFFAGLDIERLPEPSGELEAEKLMSFMRPTAGTVGAIRLMLGPPI